MNWFEKEFSKFSPILYLLVSIQIFLYLLVITLLSNYDDSEINDFILFVVPLLFTYIFEVLYLSFVNNEIKKDYDDSEELLQIKQLNTMFIVAICVYYIDKLHASTLLSILPKQINTIILLSYFLTSLTGSFLLCRTSDNRRYKKETKELQEKKNSTYKMIIKYSGLLVIWILTFILMIILTIPQPFNFFLYIILSLFITILWDRWFDKRNY